MTRKVYIVVTSFNDIPKILGIYSTHKQAREVVFAQKYWCKIVEMDFEDNAEEVQKHE